MAHDEISTNEISGSPFPPVGFWAKHFAMGPSKPGHRRKLWQVYPSRNLWYFDGRCVSGPDRTWFFISLAMLLVPACFWYGFSMEYLVHHISPGVAAASAGLVGVALVSIFLTGFTDPGILPRRPLAPLAKTPESLVYSIRDKRVSSKYCTTCHIWRPPRSSHCAVCDNCVAVYDHHCPWIGNCIGVRNYRYYLLFVNSVFLNVLYTLAFCIAEIALRTCADRDCSAGALGRALADNPVPLIVAVYLFLIAHAIGGLSGFHYYLNVRNVTTNEELKGVYRGPRNPFHRGHLLYGLHSLFPPAYPRFLPARQPIDSHHVPHYHQPQDV